MITDTINQKIAEAMKAKDEIRLSTLKLLSAALHNAKIDKREALDEKEELVVVRKEAKKRQDAIEAYQKAGAEDRAEKERKELEILQAYLPQELSEKELSDLVDQALSETGAKEMSDMGKVIKTVLEKSEGRADGKTVSGLVRQKLSHD